MIKMLSRLGIVFGVISILTVGAIAFSTNTTYAQDPDSEEFNGFTNQRLNQSKDGNADCREVTQENCAIIDNLVTIINVLSALVGVIVVAVIIVGGIQYSAAGDDPQKIKAAKGKIMNALIGLVSFIFMYAFLNWVVPGGVL